MAAQTLTHAVFGRAPDVGPHPRARRDGPGRYYAEISGIRDEAVVCEWRSAVTYATAEEARSAAIAKADGRS